MGQRPTMKDVARAAGVSHMTVSRVVNGEPGVLPETAARVEQAIRALGYQRNEMARTLRTKGQATRSIGLVVDDVANTFWSVLTRAVEDEALRRGYLVLVGSTNDDRQREQAVVSAFCSRRVDGLVVVPVAGSQQFLRTQMAMGTRVVCVDRPGDGLDVDTVVVDNRAAARDAVRHLLDQGHRRIGFVGDREDIWTAEERYAGYVSAVAGAGLPVEPRPALVGFDDFPLADRMSPPVTVVSQDPAALGTTAARMLFARIDGDDTPPRTHVVPTRLILRGSA